MEQNHSHHIAQKNTGQEAWTFGALEHNLLSGGYDRLSDCNCFLEGCDGKFATLCGKEKRCSQNTHWENEGKIFGFYY